MNEMVFKSLNEFDRYYFPKSYEERSTREMSPEDYGRSLARKAFDDVLDFILNFEGKIVRDSTIASRLDGH